MKRWSWLLLILPMVLAAGPAAYDDPESLLRRADEAFEAKQFDRAAELYDRAGVRTTHPSLAAYNLATAKYKQAKEGNAAALGAAEVNYRSCLKQGDEFRARALLGLGNCLLMRATAGATLERATLRAAMDRYAECLADPGCDDDLRADARHNRARARLLLLQAPPPPEGGDEQPPGDDQKDDKDDPKDKDKGKDADGGQGEPAKTDKGAKGVGDAKEPKEVKEGDKAGGKSKLLPPVSDDRDAVPLAKEDAERHLEEAAERIRAEAAAYRRSKARPAPAGVKDW